MANQTKKNIEKKDSTNLKLSSSKKPVVNKTSSVSKGLSDKQMDEITKNTGKILNTEDKVNLIIPKIDGESDYVECCINGYNYVIKKGEMVSVPRSVVEVLRNSKIL